MVVGSERQANKDTDKGWVFLRHPSIFTLDMAGVLLYSQPCMGLRRKERSNLGKAKTKASGGQPLPPSHLYLFAWLIPKWLSGEALQIAVKRREAKSKGEKER